MIGAAAAAAHLRHALAELRAAKTSVSKARGRLPRGDIDQLLLAELAPVLEIEKRLTRLARRLESPDPTQLPLEVAS